MAINSAAINAFYIYLAPSASASYGQQSDTTNYIDIDHAQVEAGLVPSSTIPTSGATVTRAAETLTIPAANLPWSSDAVSIQMQGQMTYADTGSFEPYFWRWFLNISNYLQVALDHTGAKTGVPQFFQNAAGTLDQVGGGSYTPGVNVPFNIASRHGSTFINGAVDGTALTANTTPVALPDLSSTDLQLGFDYMGTIKLFRIWANDLGDAGIAEAST